MSANPPELSPPGMGAPKSTHAMSPYPLERRNRTRVRVQWPVLLFASHTSGAISSVTRDLSSSGFYCLTIVPLTLGEILTCTLRIPVHDPYGKHMERCLQCKARVIRVTAHDPDGLYGIGCRIESYHFTGTIPRECR